MGKLEDIPKKQIFNVPPDYFDRLPLRIQSRVNSRTPDAAPGTFFRYAVGYALPLIVAATVLYYYYVDTRPDAVEVLASVETEDLVIYLQEAGLTTEDVLENIEFNTTELEAIENEVYDLDLPDMEPEEIDVELNTL